MEEGKKEINRQQVYCKLQISETRHRIAGQYESSQFSIMATHSCVEAW